MSGTKQPEARENQGANPPEKPEKKKQNRYQHQMALPGKTTIMYAIARVLFWIYFHLFCFLRCEGREKLKLDAPYIVIGNHTSMADPIIAAYLISRYEVNFLGKKELADVKFAGRVLLHLHMIPVDRHHSDMEAMRACLRVTKAGGVLGIFPEGTRHKEGVMEHIESGVALIALRSGVPLIPMYIDGKPRLFHRLRVRVGDPIEMADLRARGVNRDTCDELLTRITATYRDLTAAHPEA